MGTDADDGNATGFLDSKDVFKLAQEGDGNIKNVEDAVVTQHDVHI